MTKLKFAVMFALMACVAGIFSKPVKAQLSNLGIYCYSCAYNPNYPWLDPSSETQNSIQSRPRNNNNRTYRPKSSSSVESFTLEQKICAARAGNKLRSLMDSISDSDVGIAMNKAADELKNCVESR